MITKNTSKWFRGLAILMVLISHYAEWNVTTPIFEGFRSFACKLGIYGVNIFFLFSGYGLVKSIDKKVMDSDFIKKRILMVYFPYFIIIGLLSLMDGSLNSFKNIIQFIIGYDYWFMMNLFAFYILFILIWKCDKAKIAFITLGILFYSFLLYQNNYADFWIVSNFSFLIGIFAAMYEGNIYPVFQKMKSKLMLFVSLILFICGAWYFNQINKNIILQVLICIFFTFIVLILSTMIRKNGKLLSLIGTYSLYVYLLHTRIYFIMEPLFQKWNCLSKVIVIVIFTLMLSIVIGYAFQYLINRMMKLKNIQNRN